MGGGRPTRGGKGARRGPGSGADGTEECRTGVSQLESYLVWQSEVASAERDAVRFSGQFGWLPGAQREELERAYVADRLEYAEGVVDRAARRCRQMGEYYRRRCWQICARWASLCMAAVAATALLAVLPVVLRG
ncbi:cytochrome C oxidase subunit I [Kitasatospora sp. NPDC050543]|uniref:cytochrome C oxidase subunit I n=1 Tax=Kitasatospora sp. NPDC050543 TaxID=3364054 RepID=UPI0037AE0384